MTSVLVLLFPLFLMFPCLPVPEHFIAGQGITIQSAEACRVDLKELGRRASFAGSVFYKAVVNRDGVVVGLKPLKNERFMSQFLELGQFEGCIRRWRFGEQGECTIRLDAGTTGRALSQWEINVNIEGKSLTVILPGCGNR
jgi:hypothetical protein